MKQAPNQRKEGLLTSCPLDSGYDVTRLSHDLIR
jgi:hypothetical protein